MTRFARIENNTITDYSNLVGAWTDTRDGTIYINLAVWPEADRNGLGWFSIIESIPTVREVRVMVQNGKPVAQYEVTLPDPTVVAVIGGS